MPTVEDYFDDDSDLPLPSSSRSRALPHTGHRGALLEEVSTSDPEDGDLEMDMDFSKLTDQSRGIFGENTAPPPPGKGKMTVRDEPGGLRPTGGGGGDGGIAPNTPMGGFMGDMMKLQQAEDERMERLRKQFGNSTVEDPSIYKAWNTVYPLYFDAKVSNSDGRRVPRGSALWWPQATQISRAARTLGLPSVLEPDRVHPADWENPGRVKIQFVKEGRFLNPIVKNRTQLYRHLSAQMRQQNPKLIYTPPSKSSKQPTKASSSKSKSTTTSTVPLRIPTRPPPPTGNLGTLEDRLPVHSPVMPTGVAVASVKRDLENEKEAKKKGISMGGEEGGKEKQPKMKRVVVRGKR